MEELNFLYYIMIFFGVAGCLRLIIEASFMTFVWVSVACLAIGGLLWGWAGAFWTWAIIMMCAAGGSAEKMGSTGTAYVNGKAYNLTERQDK